MPTTQPLTGAALLTAVERLLARADAAVEGACRVAAGRAADADWWALKDWREAKGTDLVRVLTSLRVALVPTLAAAPTGSVTGSPPGDFGDSDPKMGTEA